MVKIGPHPFLKSAFGADVRSPIPDPDSADATASVPHDEPEVDRERCGLLSVHDEPAHVAGAQGDLVESGFRHVYAAQFRAGKVGPLEVALDERRRARVGATEIRFAQAARFEGHATKTSLAERRVIKVTIDESDVVELRFGETGTGQAASTKQDAKELGAGPIDRRQRASLGQDVAPSQRAELALVERRSDDVDPVETE